jgi:hypothetical protein
LRANFNPCRRTQARIIQPRKQQCDSWTWICNNQVDLYIFSHPIACVYCDRVCVCFGSDVCNKFKILCVQICENNAIVLWPCFNVQRRVFNPHFGWVELIYAKWIRSEFFNNNNQASEKVMQEPLLDDIRNYSLNKCSNSLL